MGKKLRIKRNYPFIIYVLLKIWGKLHFSKNSKNLYTSRFARTNELRNLFSNVPAGNSLLLGTHKFFDYFVAVHPQEKRRELGNLLAVAPTRGGKGLLAISQLLTWEHSVIVNDIKGDLFTATAGHRRALGEEEDEEENVFAFDPNGQGHCYDPLAGKKTEKELRRAATSLLFSPEEKDPIFTKRATVMLSRMFLAAVKEGIPAFPYIKALINSGPEETAKRLNHIDPILAIRFLDSTFDKADKALQDRFFLSCWSTLTTKLDPLLADPVIRSLTKSDFTAENILRGKKPVTIYLKWKEQDLQELSPLVRLIWSSLLDELSTTYDEHKGQGCKPVLALIDEAGQTAIPSLAGKATTVVGRGISLWIAIQSLSQLKVVYGEALAQVLRDNMETQLYYRPTDFDTAKYLEDRLGKISAFAQSTTMREGQEIGEGLSESAVPLLTAQQILQMENDQVIAFHRQLPPFWLQRMDWQNHPQLQKRTKIAPPELSPLPELADIPPMEPALGDFHDGYIDPDHPASGGDHQKTVFSYRSKGE